MHQAGLDPLLTLLSETGNRELIHPAFILTLVTLFLLSAYITAVSYFPSNPLVFTHQMKTLNYFPKYPWPIILASFLRAIPLLKFWFLEQCKPSIQHLN